MCGIAALVGKSNRFDLDTSIREMTDLVAHRGPDDGGHFREGNVALGHRRLAIIDLSSAGRQPFHSCDGRFVISYNGEVYNYIELREELQKEGTIFETATDTEVVLCAYQRWGSACLSRFNGMWGLVIFDREENRIFVARDRFGVKPVYYTANDDVVAIGSEIKQLLPFVDSRQVNQAMIVEFLQTGVAERLDETFFAAVKKLPAGHYAEIDCRSGAMSIERYYCLEKAAAERRAQAIDVDSFESLLTSAVALRLRADTEVGTCLSGGIDSSTVAALASRQYRSMTQGKAFSAITAVSTDPANSEFEFAQSVVEHADLAWFRTTPSYEDFQACLDDVIRIQEEPFSSPSVVMQYFVMKAARDAEIPVLLDGQGGDETLLGYETYAIPYLLSLVYSGWIMSFVEQAKLLRTNNSKMTLGTFFRYGINNALPGLRRRWYARRHDYLAYRGHGNRWLERVARGGADPRLYQTADILETNLPALLRYEDKNSMAIAIESRLPFLDYRLVETAIAMPTELKIRDGWLKWILRTVASRHLPEEIAWRKRKIGFEAPDSQWLTCLQDTMETEVMSSDAIAALVDSRRLARRYPDLDRLSHWRLFVLSRWADAFSVRM